MDTQPVVDTATQPPTEFTIGGRTFEIVPFLKEGESYISGETMLKRAKELNANSYQEDSQFILEHKDEIPQKLRGKFVLLLTGWCDPSHPNEVAHLYWDGDYWYQRWELLYTNWNEGARLVRRRPSTRA